MEMPSREVLLKLLTSLILVSVAALLLMSCGTQEPAVPSSDTAIIEIERFAFSPATTKVPVGATITWYNRESVPCTVTARDGSFDSGNLPAGGKFTYTFTQAGAFEYYCKIHPYMNGRIAVE